MIKFACSKCGKHIGVDDKFAGKRGKCPRCGAAVVVPGKSDAIRFSCEHCGHRIKVAQRHAGKKGKCPKCQEAIVVPGVRKKKEKEKAPVAEPQGPTITCSLCDQPIPVAEGTADEFVECPGCGSLVFAASGAVASAAGEEGAYEESDETARESEGSNRRRLLIIAGAAAIVVVCLIGAVLYLTSSKSEPPRRPEARRQARQVANTEPQPQPEPQPEPTTLAAAPVEEPPTPAAAPAVQLRFAPAAGTKRIVQVTTDTRSSTQGNELQQDAMNRETLTFELEVAPPDANGNTPIAVTLAAVQTRVEAGGQTVGQYDSTEPPDGANRFGELYSPFVSGRCTTTVSPQGRVVEFDMDKLYRAVAEVRLAALGDAADPRYPSREEHLLALKNQSENFPTLGKRQLCDALEKLLVDLPEQPLRTGDTWSGRGVTDIGVPIDMAATYNLAALDGEVCTIEVESQRGVDEEPLVLGTDQMTLSYALSGTSQATLKVDRQTGWLLSKQQKTRLDGRIDTRYAEKPELDNSSQVSIEITTAVTTLE